MKIEEWNFYDLQQLCLQALSIIEYCTLNTFLYQLWDAIVVAYDISSCYHSNGLMTQQQVR